MQLNLFEDNRKGILLNIADEFIHARDLVQAVSVYEQLLDDYPADQYCVALLKLVSEWCDELSAITMVPADPEKLQSIWLRLSSIDHSALRSTIIGALSDALRVLPDAERIYIPPRFHLGQIMMENGQYETAAECFQTALADKSLERGRFLAWRGDAMTLAKKNDDALKIYLEAFLDDPLTVNMQSIKNLEIINLHTSLRYDATDEIEEDEESAWLPVWGWLHGIFTLPLQIVPESTLPTAIAFANLIAEEICPVPRIWFDMLIHAERLRAVYRDDQEMAAVRRLMKKTNSFFFGCYLEKIRGKR